jgi:hypothetical protein
LRQTPVLLQPGDGAGQSLSIVHADVHTCE